MKKTVASLEKEMLAMTSIQLQSHVGRDGILKLEVPVDVTDVDLNVKVIIEPIAPATPKTPEDLGWPPGFLEQTSGAWQGEPLVRAPQGEYEIRNELE
jgi:hypothetical protein